MKRTYLTFYSLLCTFCLLVAACSKNDPAGNGGGGDGDGGDGGDGSDDSEIVAAPRDHVSVRTLLLDMVDRDELARYPTPEFTCKQFSSYDRSSTVKDGPNWYANGDANQFIRAEENEGRTEFVMMETDGPGAIVRFWMTFAGGNAGRGTLRIYIDDKQYPEIEGTAFDVLSGTTVAGGWLASSVSPLTPLEQRGHDLYYPIPYAKKCKVTYQCLETVGSGAGATPLNETVYYNINYRTYKPGTSVISYSAGDRQKYKYLTANVQKRLDERPRDTGTGHISLNCTLNPGDEQIFTISGGQAIRHIGMQISAGNNNQALRSTVLEIAFDGQRTVWVPVGDFFGIGYLPLATNMWNVSATTSGKMDAYWVMPFQSTCQITLHNYGTQQVEIDGSAGYSSWTWDNRSMYFGSDWHSYYKVNTRISPITGASGSQYDINFTKLKGKGVYVGDGVSLFNGGGGWWGEGDEKVYVDGETFPSHFGTGTEDYYGYAWCMPAVFIDHPFIAQPEGKGSYGPNYTVNARHRSLDGIPFTESLVFDMELWHWDACIMHYSPTTFWYIMPGGKTEIEPEIDNAKAKVIMNLNDFVDYSGYALAIEGESMTNVQIESGLWEYQTAFGNLWSAGEQLFWSQCNVGSKLTAQFNSSVEGTYKLTAQFAIAPDYGTVDVYINGQAVATSLNLYHGAVATRQYDLGNVTLHEGINTFEVEMKGAAPGYTQGYFGVDLLLFSEL